MCIEKRHQNVHSYSTLSQAQPQTIGFNPPPLGLLVIMVSTLVDARKTSLTGVQFILNKIGSPLPIKHASSLHFLCFCKCSAQNLGGGGGGFNINQMCIGHHNNFMSIPTQLCSYSTLSQAQPQTIGLTPPPWAAKRCYHGLQVDARKTSGGSI